jgi:hypothetical protein
MLAQSLSFLRISKLLQQLREIERILKKPLEKATNEDLKKIVIHFENSNYPKLNLRKNEIADIHYHCHDWEIVGQCEDFQPLCQVV